MTQTTSRFFDEISKLMTGAVGAAQGLRAEIEAMVRTQAEKILRDLDVVSREEFEAVKEMARKARSENDALKKRLDELEAGKGTKTSAAKKPAAKKSAAAKPKTARKAPAEKK